MVNGDFPRISVIIPTKDRPRDLTDLMKTILDQTKMPFQTIIVDSSQKRTTRNLTFSFRRKFRLHGCQLMYVEGRRCDGLPAARNLGVEFAKGDAIFFLDDDTLLDLHVIDELSNFLKDNKTALGVEPFSVGGRKLLANKLSSGKVWNTIAKILLLQYREKDRLRVRRSGESVFPSSITSPILAQRFHGYAMCYRASVFKKYSFDTNFKRSAYLEDLDFSYRVQRGNPNSLYAIPQGRVVHNISPESRMHADLRAQMITVYRFYFFFKHKSHESILNIPAFLLAQLGHIIEVTIKSAMGRSRQDTWELIYFLQSYILAFRNLRDILKADLKFFNNKVTATSRPLFQRSKKSDGPQKSII